MPRPLAIVLRAAVSGALLLAFLRWVDGRAVVAALATADPRWFAVVIGTYAVAQGFHGLAWRTLLRDAGIEVGVGEMLRHDLGSVFWSALVPGGFAGEVVKGVRLARARGQGATVATALVAARLMGGFGAGLVGLLCLPASAAAQAAAPASLAVFAGLVGAALGGLFVLSRAPAVARRWIPGGRFPSFPALARAAAVTTTTRLLFAGTTAACFAAVGHPIAVADAAWVSVATSLAELTPVTIGGFGVRELAVTALGASLVPRTGAAGAAVVLAAAVVLVVGTGGLSELHRSFRRPTPDPASLATDGDPPR